MIIHIRNFGKIKSADIDINNLTVFVGENNSGKTYLMQLIYGLFSFFRSDKFDRFIKSSKLIDINEKSIKTSGEELIAIDSSNKEFYRAFQDELNIFIGKNKKDIVMRTFHTRSLDIGSLSVEFSPLPYRILLRNSGEYEKNGDIYNRYLITNKKNWASIRFLKDYPKDELKKTLTGYFMYEILSGLSGLNIRRITPFIYLPASRSGIMLLYADYLSKDIKRNSRYNEDIEDSDNIDDTENQYGLTEPMNDFLMFLLNHKTNEMVSEMNNDIISFINNNIINGRFEKNGGSMRYIPGNAENSLPIYLSSSLASELSPVYMLLSGFQPPKFIMYDEIETCQHPTKQLQLARLLIRMVNKNYRMIVSTHSDTMAAAINNLVTLSFKKNKNELLDKLGYDKADILSPENIVKAYQFVIGQDGMTTVVEIPSHFSVGVGFDFDIFNNANDKIYQDAVLLSEAE